MSNELDIYGKNQLTANEVRSQINLIQEVMQSVMKEGVHYGNIPGCGDKPCLLKPGAEKILATFRLSAEPIVDDLSSHDEVRYRIKSIIVSPSGRAAGYGIGECSSNEEKHKWKKAVCDAEWQETAEDRRREKWVKGRDGNPDYKVKQIRTNIADVANTVLKMSKKRSLVDGCLTTTACSDIFEQDIEELDGVIDLDTGKTKVKTPKSKSATATTSSEPAKTDGLVKVRTSITNVTQFECKNKSMKYTIHGDGEAKYSTFDVKLATGAKSFAGTGVQVEITHKPDAYKTIEAIDTVQEEPLIQNLSKLAEKAAEGLNL